MVLKSTSRFCKVFLRFFLVVQCSLRLFNVFQVSSRSYKVFQGFASFVKVLQGSSRFFKITLQMLFWDALASLALMVVTGWLTHRNWRLAILHVWQFSHLSGGNICLVCQIWIFYNFQLFVAHLWTDFQSCLENYGNWSSHPTRGWWFTLPLDPFLLWPLPLETDEKKKQTWFYCDGRQNWDIIQ